jgi:hypothetical protein
MSVGCVSVTLLVVEQLLASVTVSVTGPDGRFPAVGDVDPFDHE